MLFHFVDMVYTNDTVDTVDTVQCLYCLYYSNCSMRSKSSWDDGTNVAEIANMGYVFDGVQGTDRAERDRADMGDATNVAEMALRNA